MTSDSNLESLTAPESPFLFFTGKGGVGKTSLSCATAIHLADQGKRVLLVSTDPASNLDEVLGTTLDRKPRPVKKVSGLDALNINPEAAAAAYREKLIGPLRGQLPEAAIRSVEEQLSGACTVEIAAFDEFSSLLGNPSQTDDYDHVIFDTAPTGHTLRLLALPGAWTGFLNENTTGTSCLGPLAGLEKQRTWYTNALNTLSSAEQTQLVLVSRPDQAPLAEAERAGNELSEIGVKNQVLVLNGIFETNHKNDALAKALERRQKMALSQFENYLKSIPVVRISLRSYPLIGIEALRSTFNPELESAPKNYGSVGPIDLPPLSELTDDLASTGTGLIMTMGKGGVGKTTIACALAVNLAERGLSVCLTTTDPAAHLTLTLNEAIPTLRIERIDPSKVTKDYVSAVRRAQEAGLDPDGLALLEEDLSSPCTEEIAVFQAFAKTVAEAEKEIVIIDTAPTGHTLLLLDAAESYHREVGRQTMSTVSAEVTELLPRLRDPRFTRILLVTQPEPTPVHEASSLQEDLNRAEISPTAWVVNQSFHSLPTSDPVLSARAAREIALIEEVQSNHESPTYLIPWQKEEPLGLNALRLVLSEEVRQ